MYYGSGIETELLALAGCIFSSGRTLHVHSTDGSTFLREMKSWPSSWKCDVK